MFHANGVENDLADTLKSREPIGKAAKDRKKEIDTKSRILAKSHRSRLRRGKRVGAGQKLVAEASYLQVQMRQICYNVSGFGIPLDALQRRPPPAAADLFERLGAAKRVICRPRVPQLVQHGTLNSEKIAGFLYGANHGFSGHAKNGGVWGSFSRDF